MPWTLDEHRLATNQNELHASSERLQQPLWQPSPHFYRGQGFREGREIHEATQFFPPSQNSFANDNRD